MVLWPWMSHWLRQVDGKRSLWGNNWSSGAYWRQKKNKILLPRMQGCRTILWWYSILFIEDSAYIYMIQKLLTARLYVYVYCTYSARCVHILFWDVFWLPVLCGAVGIVCSVSQVLQQKDVLPEVWQLDIVGRKCWMPFWTCDSLQLDLFTTHYWYISY